MKQDMANISICLNKKNLFYTYHVSYDRDYKVGFFHFLRFVYFMRCLP